MEVRNGSGSVVAILPLSGHADRGHAAADQGFFLIFEPIMAAHAASIAPAAATSAGAPWSVAIIQTAPPINVSDAASIKATISWSRDGEGLFSMGNCEGLSH